MDGVAFDRVVQRVGLKAGRRAVLAAVAGAGLLGVASTTHDLAARRKKRKKIPLCQGGQTVKVSKKQKKKLVQAGATPGACPACIATSDDLQAAIDAAQPGDTLTLCAGQRNLTAPILITKDLTLNGSGREQTILDGGNSVQVLKTDLAPTLLLQDLTIARGNASGAEFNQGGGIDTRGVTIPGGDLTLRRVAVTNCRASDGGGIHPFTGTATLEDGTLVTGNTANQGGGIFLNGSTVVMATGSRVSENTATNTGGGIAVGAGGTLTLQAGSRVTDNTSTAPGGGIFNIGKTTLEAGSSVTGNDPDDCSGPRITGACG